MVSNNRYFQKVTEKGRTVFCLVRIYIEGHGIEQVWQHVGKHHMNERQRVGKYHMNEQQGVGNHMAYSQFIERPYIWHGSSNFTSRPAMFLTNFFFLKVTGTNLSLPKQASRRHNFKTVFNGSDTIRVLVTYRRPKGKLMDTHTM